MRFMSGAHPLLRKMKKTLFVQQRSGCQCMDLKILLLRLLHTARSDECNSNKKSRATK